MLVEINGRLYIRQTPAARLLGIGDLRTFRRRIPDLGVRTARVPGSCVDVYLLEDLERVRREGEGVKQPVGA